MRSSGCLSRTGGCQKPARYTSTQTDQLHPAHLILLRINGFTVCVIQRIDVNTESWHIPEVLRSAHGNHVCEAEVKLSFPKGQCVTNSAHSTCSRRHVAMPGLSPAPPPCLPSCEAVTDAYWWGRKPSSPEERQQAAATCPMSRWTKLPDSKAGRPSLQRQALLLPAAATAPAWHSQQAQTCKVPSELLAAWWGSSRASDQKGTCTSWWSKGQGSEQVYIYTLARQNVTTEGQGNWKSDIKLVVQILLWIRAGEKTRIPKWNSHHWYRQPSRAVQSPSLQIPRSGPGLPALLGLGQVVSTVSTILRFCENKVSPESTHIISRRWRDISYDLMLANSSMKVDLIPYVGSLFSGSG